jgi:hypothetical protein
MNGYLPCIMKKSLFFSFIFFNLNTYTKLEAPEQNAVMTIFVHGTLKPAEFSFSSLVKIMSDRTDNTLYSRAIHYMRHDPVLFQGQAIQELGLQPIIMAEDTPHKTTRTIAQMYNLQNRTLKISDVPQLYYTFGWSGLLSQTKRYIAAEDLYYQLTKELNNLKKIHFNPFIRVIAFSHGGNVVLNLSAVQNSDPFATSSLIVDELISISTPIQRETDHLVTDPMFKKVYHLYSKEDNIQMLDLFSSQQFFSKRQFSQRSSFYIPEKLHQVRIRTTKHIKWKEKIKEKEHPYQGLDKRRIRLVHKDPQHTEMWNFKWAAHCYREKAPLNPLPLMVFVPTILHILKTYQPDRRNVTLDIAPTEYGALIKQRRKMFKQAVPFLPEITYNNIMKLAKLQRPKDFTIEAQQEHVALALQKAQDDLMKIKKYRKPHSRKLTEYMKRLDLGKFDTNSEVKLKRITQN